MTSSIVGGYYSNPMTLSSLKSVNDDELRIYGDEIIFYYLKTKAPI